MTIAFKIIKTLFYKLNRAARASGSTRDISHVEGPGTFATSTMASYFTVHEPGQLIGVAGGAVAAVAAVIYKAV